MLSKLVCVLLSATVIHVSLRADETINDLPLQYKASIEWVCGSGEFHRCKSILLWQSSDHAITNIAPGIYLQK